MTAPIQPTEFVVTDLSIDAKMVRGAGSVIHGYNATLSASSLTTPDGERGEGVIELRHTKRFPWQVGDVVKLPIPWNGEDLSDYAVERGPVGH